MLLLNVILTECLYPHEVSLPLRYMHMNTSTHTAHMSTHLFTCMHAHTRTRTNTDTVQFEDNTNAQDI